MNRSDPGLERALHLTQQILSAAERADLSGFAQLDAERTQLIHSFRRQTVQVGPHDQALLRKIAELNDHAIGLLEHHQRAKARELDMAAVGRRAVAAYSGTR
jgi:hypothetical protein